MFGRGHVSTTASLIASVLFSTIASAQESQPPAPSPGGPVVFRLAGDMPADVVRLSLNDAQQRAQAANDPLVRLGQLQVEAARQHRLGVKSMYFPSVTTQFVNLHLNETPGQLLTFRRPLQGGLISVPVEVVFQDQTTVNVVATQPITQLFAVRQLVNIAEADENIAKAKAGMPLTSFARRPARARSGRRRCQEGANELGENRRFRIAGHGGTAG